MVVCCAVANCTNRAKKGSGITFHSFPSDKEMLAKWLRAIGRENFKPNDFSKICSAHFANEDLYTDKYKRRFVKKGVIPTRFYNARKSRRGRKIAESVPEASSEVVISTEDTEIIYLNSVSLNETNMETADDEFIENTANRLKKMGSVRRNGEIGLEDYEKINEARLTDPKVVKQLLSIAYKTIREQRKQIVDLRLKCKNMEQKVAFLHKALRELHDCRSS